MQKIRKRVEKISRKWKKLDYKRGSNNLTFEEEWNEKVLENFTQRSARGK